jgi:uncharacterized protein (TIGR03086 family)
MTATENTVTADPRPLYGDALDWVTGLVAGVRSDQLTGSTPCSEFDVRTLLGHVVATIDKIRVIGEGGSPFTMPHVAPLPADDHWTGTLAEAVERMWAVWSDDTRLDAVLTAPWGTAPGRGVLWGYLNETLVHGWDVAVATGQEPETDPALVGAVLAMAQRMIPAEPRGGEMPFAPVVAPAPEAGPTERLANWSGHAR